MHNQGFGARASYIDGSETLRHPVDIFLLELKKEYIFWSLYGSLLKKFIFWALGAGSRLKIDGSETLCITTALLSLSHPFSMSKMVHDITYVKDK